MKTLHLKKTLLDLKRLLCPDDRAFALPKKVMYIFTKPAMRLGLKSDGLNTLMLCLDRARSLVARLALGA